MHRMRTIKKKKNDDDNKKQEKPPCLLLTSPVGTPLLEHMKSLRDEGARHSFAQRVLEELKLVLAAVHAEGVVHGDIKPDNVMVADNGDIFLIDWGCAVEEVVEVKGWWWRSHRTAFMSDEFLLVGRALTPGRRPVVAAHLFGHSRVAGGPCSVALLFKP